MSRVRFLRGTVLGAGEVAEVGDEVELDATTATFFVKQGRALFVDDSVLPEDSGIITVEDTPKAKASRTR